MNTATLPRAMIGESRRHVRVPENARVLWHIRGNGLVGQGRVCNISAAGMRVELSSINPLPVNNVFSFDSNLNDANYIPDTARLVWHNKKRFSSDKYVCGFEFGGLPEVLASRLNKRVEDGVKDLVKTWKLNRAAGIFGAAVTVALLGYAIWLGGIIFQGTLQTNQKLLTAATQQADLTREYQQLYTDTTRRLADVTLELNQTAVLYQEAQNRLAASQQELSVTKSVLSETEALLAQSKTENVPGPAGGIQTVQDGKKMIASYRDRIQQVVAQIDRIKYQDYLNRVAALAERDRLRAIYGNQGFFVKSGQPVQVDMRQYEAANLNAFPVGTIPKSDSKVRVNVTVFQ